MKVLFFILALTIPIYSKPADAPIQIGKNDPNSTKMKTGNREIYHKFLKQDEDGDDGDEAGGFAAGLGNIFGGGSGSTGPSSVTGLLLNGLTGGLFAGLIPGETGQAVNNLYNQFTDPFNKFLEGQINAGVKNLLATTTQKSKATSRSPTTPRSVGVVQEVTVQKIPSQNQQLSSFSQIRAPSGAAVSPSGGHSLISAEKLSNGNQPIPPQHNQNSRFSPLLNAIATPRTSNEARGTEQPYGANFADTKHINANYGNQAFVSPLSINETKFQSPSSTPAGIVETTTEDEDGDDGDDEDNRI